MSDPGLLLDTWELYNFDNSHHFLTSNAAPGPVFIAMITVWMELWFTIYTQGRHSENIFGWKREKLLLHITHYKLLWLCFKIEEAFHVHNFYSIALNFIIKIFSFLRKSDIYWRLWNVRSKRLWKSVIRDNSGSAIKLIFVKKYIKNTTRQNATGMKLYNHVS